jgi:hypothetical protein
LIVGQIDQVRKNVERRGGDWRQVNQIQEWAYTELETPMQKSTHKCGNNLRRRKKKRSDIQKKVLSVSIQCLYFFM